MLTTSLPPAPSWSFSTSIILHIPYPPSHNKIWRANWNAHKIYNHPEYQSWVKLAWGTWLQQKPSDFQTIKTEFAITIMAFRPDKRRRDLGNLKKAIMDMLQRINVIYDDAMTVRETMLWGTPGTDTGCLILIQY